MKILLTGATGFIGASLGQTLKREGHLLVALSRNEILAQRRLRWLERAFRWDSQASPPPAEAFAGVEAVIHLAGESVAGRWNAARKRAIRDSRVVGTHHLVAGMEALEQRPRVLVSASAVGYYGDRGETPLMEDAPPGTDFLARVCRDWEEEAIRAQGLGLRVVRLRLGMVLGPQGGAVQAMLPLFKLGLGGPLGWGRQWWSWVHRDDVIGLVRHALKRELEGPLNVTAPEPVRQKAFAAAMGRVLGRPAFVPAPSLALKIVLGEFSQELLASKRVLPQRAQEAGYDFLFPSLDPALRGVLAAWGQPFFLIA